MKTSLLIVAAFLVTAGCTGGRSVAQGKERTAPPAQYNYSGGSGGSAEEAVVILGAHNQREAVEAEYAFIGQKYGKRGKEWSVAAQSLRKEENKVYDCIEIEVAGTSDRRYFYFDVTRFSWIPK